MEAILQVPPLDAADPAPLGDAMETMRQQVLAKAENAYAVTAICQYRATVSSRFTDDPANNRYAPRFYGTIDASARAAGDAKNDTSPLSFTAARSILAPGRAFVSTALTVADLRTQSHLPLHLSFRLANVEHDIIEGVDGDCIASSRLSFVIPFDRAALGAPQPDTTIGNVDIPVVLRAVPAAPTLVAQEAVPTPDDDPAPARALEQARHWSYAFAYEKDVAAQDTIDCSVTFDLGDVGLRPLPTERPLDLFDHLARFVTVWPAMEQAMSVAFVPDTMDLDPASDAYRNARMLVADFYRLLEPMPAAWSAWHARMQHATALHARLDAPSSSSFSFSVQEENASGVLVVRRTLGASSARVWDPVTAQLVPLPPPQLTIDDGERVWSGTADAENPDLFAYTNDGRTLTYGAAQKLRRRRLTFRGSSDGLDVAAYQSGWSSVKVFRNLALVRDARGQTIPTTPDFVYSTPQVRFASRATPFLQRTRSYDVSALSSPPRQALATHLTRVVSLLCEGTERGTAQLIRLDAEYAQTIGVGLPAAVAPILLSLPTTVTLEGTTALAKEAAGCITRWFADRHPADGVFQFTLTLFATLGTSQLPLLQMSGLRLACDDVTDLSRD